MCFTVQLSRFSFALLSRSSLITISHRFCDVNTYFLLFSISKLFFKNKNGEGGI